MATKAKAIKKSSVKIKASKKTSSAKSKPSALGGFLSFNWLNKNKKK